MLFHSKHQCTGCQKKTLCSVCADKFVLPEGKHGIENCVTALCLDCFKSTCSINFEQKFDFYGDKSHPAVVLVHGSAGSRAMWPRAMIDLIVGQNFCVYSVDLPGHGSRMHEKLTVDSAVASLSEVYDEHIKKPCVWIGNSLGGYSLIALIGARPEIVKDAILAGCSQNTCEVDSSFKARAGLFVLGAMSGLLGNGTLMKALISQVPKTVSAQLIEDTFLRSGAYFSTSADGSVQILKHVNPAECLPKATTKHILFVTGANDHHDSLERWTTLTGGKSIMYPDVDHFFSHDDRTMDKWHQDVIQFLKESTSSV